jgi:pimeloyl-ACP methyl ester carboxylesterase
MVVQELLLADQVPVGTAVLCDTIPGATEQVRQINETLADLAESGGSEALADALAPGLIGPGPLEATDRASLQTRAVMAASEPDSLARALRAICRFDALDRLGSIDRPVLVVAGEYEPNLEDQRRLAGALRRGSLLVMKGAGHMAPMEAPSTFAGALASYIERADKGRT